MDLYSFVMNLPTPEVKALTEACVNRLERHTRMVDADHMTSGERLLCSKGERIKAVKSIKERTGLGLAESKAIMDKEYPKPDIDALLEKGHYLNSEGHYAK